MRDGFTTFQHFWKFFKGISGVEIWKTLMIVEHKKNKNLS